MIFVIASEQVGAGVLGLPQAVAYLTWGPGMVRLLSLRVPVVLNQQHVFSTPISAL